MQLPWTPKRSPRPAVDAILETEEGYRRFVEGLPVVVYVDEVNRSCSSLYISPQIEAILGYSPEDWQSDPDFFPKLLHPDDRERVLTEHDGLMAGGEMLRSEYRLRSRDGRDVWFRDEARIVCDQEGRPLYTEGYLLDITEQKMLEAQLRQAQKMEGVGRLAGGIAHDFNNLLTAISGYSALLAEQLDDGGAGRRFLAELERELAHCAERLEEVRERHGADSPVAHDLANLLMAAEGFVRLLLDRFDADPLADLQQIRDAAERATSLTRQLLAFSRRQMLQPRVVDLNSVVSSVDVLLRRLIGEDIELVTTLAPDVSPVIADPGQLEQVLVNLAVNARDAMPDGGKLIFETASVELDELYARQHVGVEPGRYAMVAVSDTGTGMDRETLAQAFEPFFTTKGLGKGTGLGLSTVIGIVEQSGGSVRAYSEPGRGSTFKVYLPAADLAVEPALEPAAPPARGSETILLVEDEPSVRAFARRVLVQQGYAVYDIVETSEALRFCEQHPGPIHLVVTDVVMPQMSGPELVARMAPLRPDMRVLYTSGYTDEAVVEHGVTNGAAFLQKPFAAAEMVRKVREVLDGRRAAA